MLVQITAPHFCAGIILKDDIVIEAAPILRRITMGKSRPYLSALFERKRWTAFVVTDS